MRRMLIFLGLWSMLLFVGMQAEKSPRPEPGGPASVYEANGGCTDPFGAPRPCS